MGIWQTYRLRLERKRLRLRARRKRRELAPVADRTAAIRPGDILVLSTFRNEAVRLPWFLKYYRDLGVDHFLMVDNASDDGGREWLAEQPDVSLWTTPASYKRARFGADWLNGLAMRHAVGHWCLTVDPDELLVYPFCDTRPLRALTDWLDASSIQQLRGHAARHVPQGAARPRALPGRARTRSRSRTGSTPATTRSAATASYGNLWIQGGPRARSFFVEEPWRAPALNKIPLVKWDRATAYASSTHMLLPRGLNLVYDEWGGEKASGVLLHTKFLSTFAQKAEEELAPRPALRRLARVPRLREPPRPRARPLVPLERELHQLAPARDPRADVQGELGVSGDGPARRRPRGTRGAIGVVILVHAAFDRAEQVIRHWAARRLPGGGPRRRGRARRAVRRLRARRWATSWSAGAVAFSPRHRCEWGTWGIVAATLDACELLLARAPRRRATSTSPRAPACRCARSPPCATTSPSRPGTDFIESATTADVPWTVGGLSEERFTLRFPFSWKRHRRLFDGYVALQRRLGPAPPHPGGPRAAHGLASGGA